MTVMIVSRKGIVTNHIAIVLGVDLSPMQPTFLPPNLRFEIDDLEERWLYHQKFDLIHTRGMSGSFKNWPRFFEQAFEFTTPGGYLHVHDSIYPLLCDDDSLKGTALEKWSQLSLDGTVVSLTFYLVRHFSRSQR